MSLLPGLMQKEEYRDSHILQCIIRMQSYNYGSEVARYHMQHTTSGNEVTQNFEKQVNFLVVFKEKVFLPRDTEVLL